MILSATLLSLAAAIGCDNTFWRTLDSQFRAIENSPPPQSRAQALLAVHNHAQLFQTGMSRIGEFNDQEALDWYLGHQTICPTNSSICEPMSHWISSGILQLDQIQKACPAASVSIHHGELEIWLDGPQQLQRLNPYARSVISTIGQLNSGSYGDSRSTVYCQAVLRFESLLANQNSAPRCDPELTEHSFSRTRLQIALTVLGKESLFNEYPDFVRNFYRCYKNRGADSNLIQILRWRLTPPGKPRSLISTDPTRPALHEAVGFPNP